MLGPPIIGVSQNITKAKDIINRIADTGLSILISGESGVGKEVIAQNLFQKSFRNKNSFLKINCAALPEGLLESELFGYEQGAFTGAQRKKKGKFELAHKGVLFLDEIGDMSFNLQAKLLHVLQSGEFAPLGSEKDIKSDVWIIAASNQNLEKNIKKGTFREDLYYRLNTINIHIAPLRERPEDIIPIAEYYIKQYAIQFKSGKIIKPGKKIMEQLAEYNWQGNVRELQNVLKRALVMGDWEDVLKSLGEKPSEPGNSGKGESDKYSLLSELMGFDMNDQVELDAFSLKKIRQTAIDRVEKEVIACILDKTGWNRTKATKILEISYKTLLSKISSLDIEPPPSKKLRSKN